MSQSVPSRSARITEAHELLAEYYGERVAPVSSVCNAIGDYITAISAEGAGSPWGDETTEAIRTHGFVIMTMARKSNLLYRLIYMGQPLRTKKCPEHDGHWSGCYFDGRQCECMVGYDVTGWLPDA